MFGKIQSLHSHTILSDGKVTHLQSLDLANKLGIGVIGFTEHDFLPDEKTVRALQGLNHPTKWFLGIEVTVSSIDGDNMADIHLLGLFVDPTNKELREHCEKALEGRFDKMRQRVKKFQELGFEVTEKEVFDQSSGNSIGRPHLVAAILAKDKNQRLIKEWVEKMRLAGEEDSGIAERYKNMMQQAADKYIYPLFLNEDKSFFEISVVEPYSIDFDKAVGLIRKAGGISSIAHYSTSRRFLPAELMEKLFKEDRLDGAETAYGFRTFGTDLQVKCEADRQMLRDLIKKYDKIPTGGGDTHIEKDFQEFAANPWINEETVGMVENIMSKKNVDKSYSNLD